MKVLTRAAVYFVGLSGALGAIVGITIAAAKGGWPYIVAEIVAVLAIGAWSLAKLDDL